ncbi:Protein of unknown function [Paenimyroides ummariense]|uniref:DUF2975 domain-containing protein n=1 Tax=Paenimyroides ummariense TaxID=913024 RepID=A0A1I5AGD8_9FLAO|nr:DUF2975 domain-containing protein [Paenimyroides ummariense]SFN61534.1 Protein of unknown function [Paenimyroides ummariense]
MKLLKSLISFTYNFFIVLTVLMFIVLAMIWTNTPEKLIALFNEDFDTTYVFTISFVVELFSYVLFFIILQRMKIVVSNFYNKNYFNLENSKYIKQIGWVIIITFLIDDILLPYIIPYIEGISGKEIFVNFVEILYLASSKLFIGLFLLGIGKAFELGLKQQQENELTI